MTRAPGLIETDSGNEGLLYEIAVSTDKGKIKAKNEDAVVLDRFPGGIQIAILADGMGGENNGKLASALATTVTRDCLRKDITSVPNTIDDLASPFEQAIAEAHQQILARTQGGGSTLTSAILWYDDVLIAQIGDSRAYDVDIQSRRIHQITQDDVPTVEKVRIMHPELTEMEARVLLAFSSSSAIANFLGSRHEELSTPTILNHTLLDGHALLLCSDGLHKALSDEEILNLMTSESNSQKIADMLVSTANAKDGSDNITTVVISKNKD